MAQERQGGRFVSQFPRQWVPLTAIVLGLLGTIVLGRLVDATRLWLSPPAPPQAIARTFGHG